MKLKLENQKSEDTIKAGDIIVFEEKPNLENRKRGSRHYLVIEDVPFSRYSLLLLENNRLMSNTVADTPQLLLQKAVGMWSVSLRFIEVIKAEDVELVRK